VWLRKRHRRREKKYSLIICQTEMSEELNFKVQNEMTEKKAQTLPRSICCERSGATSAVCINTAERVWYTQQSPVEIQTPTQWDMIGCSMTAPPLVLSTGSIFPATFVSLPLHLRKEKFGAVFQNATSYIYFYFFNKTFVSVKLDNLKFRKSRSFCNIL